MPVNFSISINSGVPIYRQIVEQVAAAVAIGKLAAEDPLPSVRALAEQLVINPNTVGRAYAELVREGVIEARPGRGMVIAQRRQVYAKAERTRRLEQAASVLVNEAVILGCELDEVIAAVNRGFRELGKSLVR
jgi:GntR family transcriptional regulator